MNICSQGHDEICYEGRDCPVCDLMSDYKYEIDGHIEIIDKLNNEITDLKKEIERLNNLE